MASDPCNTAGAGQLLMTGGLGHQFTVNDLLSTIYYLLIYLVALNLKQQMQFVLSETTKVPM